jgi:hypothetical protein
MFAFAIWDARDRSGSHGAEAAVLCRSWRALSFRI